MLLKLKSHDITIFEDDYVYRITHNGSNAFIFKPVSSPHFWIGNRLFTFASWDCVEHGEFPDWIKGAVREIEKIIKEN